MKNLHDYAVVYDISDDRERRKVDKILKGYGFRIQKSVFECRLTQRYKKELIDRFAALELKTGFVKMYRLEYSSKNISIGIGLRHSPDEAPAFIV